MVGKKKVKEYEQRVEEAVAVLDAISEDSTRRLQDPHCQRIVLRMMQPAPNNNTPALLCRSLRMRYGAVVAVDGLDLEVLRGECFGLLGPNGAGKTTTIEILEGLNRPDSGVVQVLGQSWGAGHDRALRERLGIQLQETRFYDKYSVHETITLFRSFYRRGPTPDDVIRRVQLEEKRDAWVVKLSGGQKQRLSVACALVNDPGITAAIGLASELLRLDPVTDGALGLAWALIVGWHAHDWRRRALERRGYVTAGMVAAPNLLEAERRFFARQPGRAVA